MKRIFLMSMPVILVSIIIFSCNKVSPTTTVTKQTKVTRIPVGLSVWFTWDEWGRKAIDCKGNGLCRFRLKDGIAPILDAGETGVQVLKENENYFVNVLVDNNTVFEPSSTSLYVDEDIVASSENGTTFRLAAGVYKLNSNLGSNGGYTLPLESTN